MAEWAVHRTLDRNMLPVGEEQELEVRLYEKNIEQDFERIQHLSIFSDRIRERRIPKEKGKLVIGCDSANNIGYQFTCRFTGVLEVMTFTMQRVPKGQENVLGESSAVSATE